MKTIACVNLNNKEIFESSVKFGVYSGFKDIINEIYTKKGFDHVIRDGDIEEHINLKKTPIYKDWEINKSKIISDLKFFIQKRDFRDDINKARDYYNRARAIFGEENVSMITSSLNVQTVIIAQPDIKKEILIKISEDEYNFLKESFPGTNDAKLYFVAEQIKEHNVKPRIGSNFYVKKQKFSFHNGQRSGSGKIGNLDFDDSIKLILNVFLSDLEFYNIIDGTFDYNISNYEQFTENVISSLKDGRLFKDDNQILMAKEFVYAFIRNEIQIGEDISSIDSELLESFLFNLYSENGDVISQEESQKKREEDINIFLDRYKFLVDGVRNLSGKGSSVAKFFEENAYNARAIEYFDFKTLIDYINKDAFRNSQTQIKYLKDFEEIDKSMPNSTKMAALDTIIQFIKNAVFENKRILFDNGINPEEDYSFEDIYERFCEKTGLTEFFYNKIKNLTKQLNIRVKFATEFSSSQYYGQFFATSASDEDAGKINVSSIAFKNKQTFSETLIHETLHALSIRIISDVNSGKIDGLTPLQIKGVKNIIKIYNEIKNDPNIPRKYVVSDVLEFVAALTEKDFYDYLKSKDKSIIEKIKEFFANLFNIDINQDPYIYKQTVKNLDRLIGDGSYLIKNGIITDKKDYNAISGNPELVYKKKDGSKIFPEKKVQEKETESSFQSDDIIWKKVDSFGKTIKEKQTQNQQPDIIQGQENVKSKPNNEFINLSEVYNISSASNTESTLSNSNQIKQGVVKLFEENPKLANAVYEALGYSQERSLPTSSETINIYAGSNQNAELSNFAIRPFTTNVETSSGEKQYTFQSVEQGFHFYKALVANNPQIAKQILATTNGGQLKRLTNKSNLKMTPEQVKEWDDTSKSIMLNLMYDSYVQNPEAAEKLLATGNAKITHTQDNTRWKTDFPDVVMTVRDMLKEEGFDIQFQITSQQKQQAQLAYSKYLNTIFPDSKVKDIVYRGKTDSQSNQKSKELGIFFTDDKNSANIYAVKYKGDEFDDSIIQGIVNKFGLNPTIEQIKSEIAFFEKMGATEEQIEKDAKEYQEYIQNNKGITEQAIVNIENPKNLTVKDWFDNYDNGSSLKENSDGLLLKGGKQSDNRIYDAGENQIVVFEPEQIHILGSKQDIEGFKDFVQGKQFITPRKGISELFSENPQLASIGTSEQYSQYLDTIFPESKVKDIVYHGTPKISKDNAYERLNLWEQYQDDLITEEEYNERIKQFPENPVIEKFDKSKIGSQSNSGLKKGFYFSTNKKVALWNESNNLYRAIVNSVNPQTIEGDSKKINFSKLKEATEKGDVVYKNTIDALENNTELLGDTIVVQEPEQIHILGSKQDIQGFKAFVESNNTKTNNSELIDKNTESEIKPIVDAENKTIKNNYETFKEVQDFFDSNLSTMDNIYNTIFNNSEITPDDIIKQIIKTDNVEKECNGGVSNSSWEIV